MIKMCKGVPRGSRGVEQVGQRELPMTLAKHGNANFFLKRKGQNMPRAILGLDDR